MRHPVLRSWPWTLALAVILAGFVLLGVVGLLARTSGVEVAVSLIVTGVAAVGLSRVLGMGVVVTPSGLIIRELTRTTLVEWTSIRTVESGPTERRRVFAPALRLGTRVSATGRELPERLELTVLASYSPQVAQHRADQLAAALAAVRPSKRRR